MATHRRTRADSECLHCRIMAALGAKDDAVVALGFNESMDALCSVIADLISPLDAATRAKAIRQVGSDVARKIARNDASPVKRTSLAPPAGSLH